MMTLEQLKPRRSDGTSKKRKFAEITGNLEISKLSGSLKNDVEDEAAELNKLFE